MKQALILVDIQYDFLPGGALAVKEGDQIIPIVNDLMSEFTQIYATQDWHPQDHGSFAANHSDKRIGEIIDLNGLPQVLWPVHCVQNSHGASLSDQLDLSRIDKIFQKGTDKTIDSYSGFFDNGKRKATGMGAFLKAQKIDTLTIVGLATDYCVKYTAMDAVDLGFSVRLVLDASRGVELQEGDVSKAIQEMKAHGITIV